MENIGMALLIVLGLVFTILLWIAPYLHAKKVDHPYVQAIGVLTLLTLILPICWIVAAVWCVVGGKKPQPKGPARIVRSTPLNYREPVKTSNMDDELEATMAEKCENCGCTIGKLETPKLWKLHVVCDPCYDKLSKAKTTAV